MKNLTAVIDAKHSVTWEEEVAAEVPAPDQLLVKADYTLISAGTELAMYNRTHIGFSDPENNYARYPVYPGYCATGAVLACGDAVAGYAVGDRIFYSGKHQAYSLVDPGKQIVHRLPEGLDPRLAPYSRMAQIAATAPSLCDARAGASVSVIGLGVVGNLCAQIYRLRGARVVGIDPVADRCRIAEACGIETVCSGAEEAGDALEARFGARATRVVVEATGHPAVIGPALDLSLRLGEIVLLGSSRGTSEIDTYNQIHRHGRVVRGGHMMTLPVKPDGSGLPDQDSLVREFLGHTARGALAIEPLLSEVMPANELKQAYDNLNEKPGAYFSILLDWTSSE